MNYKAHAKETNSDTPKEPIVFNKSPNCIVGPNDNVVIPKFSNSLDHEVEIAIIIGSKARYVKEEEAEKFVLGYCICNDISEREWQKNRGGQWVKGKSGDTFGPLGPYLVTKDEIKQIESLVNQHTLNNAEVKTELMQLEDAIASGAEAMFGEKYDDEVRVLSMGDGFSVELCGGTHVSRTGDIGMFTILSESSVSSGVRRIEASEVFRVVRW